VQSKIFKAVLLQLDNKLLDLNEKFPSINQVENTGQIICDGIDASISIACYVLNHKSFGIYVYGNLDCRLQLLCAIRCTYILYSQQSTTLKHKADSNSNFDEDREKLILMRMVVKWVQMGSTRMY